MWKWEQSRLVDEEGEAVLWTAQDHLGRLYLGVMADHEDKIAAAPNLLAALSAVLAAMPTTRFDMASCKACGATGVTFEQINHWTYCPVPDAIDALKKARGE